MINIALDYYIVGYYMRLLINMIRVLIQDCLWAVVVVDILLDITVAYQICLVLPGCVFYCLLLIF
jgi:hypothetical protein